MKPTEEAEQLISELLADPGHFRGGYELLQAYLKGAPQETLRPLLRSGNLPVQQEAIWIVAELGRLPFVLLDDVMPLVDSGDRYLAYYAMESVTVCATGVRAPAFVHVVVKLEDPDDVLRSRAVFLMSNVEISQLAASADAGLHSQHREGLRLLLEPSASDEAVLSFLHSDKGTEPPLWRDICRAAVREESPIDRRSEDDGRCRDEFIPRRCPEDASWPTNKVRFESKSIRHDIDEVR